MFRVLWASAAISLWVITHTLLFAECIIISRKAFKKMCIERTSAPRLHGNIYFNSHCIAAECCSHVVRLYCWARVSVCVGAAESWSEGKHRLWENTNRVSLRLDSSWRQIKVFWWEHNPVFPCSKRAKLCCERLFFFLFTIMHKSEVITPRGGGLTLLNPPQIQWAHCDK